MLAQTTLATTQTITHTQSLAAVQTLLRAGLSCVTFLRNLLPEDNFTQSHLTSADDSISSEATPESHKGGRHNSVNGFKIMTMVRGYTDEGDRILNYLEKGIFDALEKQYLRSFIFAIYLDSKDPNNIVEAYTFNFKYHKIAGTNTVAPIMTLGDELQNMTLNGQQRRAKDPVAEALQAGRLPTVKEVKKSIKTMIKTLIQAITPMDQLPRRRFATFKLYYNDSTPENYEPPNFQTGDADKDRWYFMTHNLDEVPDKFSVGKVNCGHHSVDLKVTSVATYLPSSKHQDNELFTGTIDNKSTHNPFNSIARCAGLAQEAELQEEDARARNLVWSAEDDEQDEDGEGEDESGVEILATGFYLKDRPIGVRNEDGSIERVAVTASGTLEAHYEGLQEKVVTRLQEVGGIYPEDMANLEETQALLETQDMNSMDVVPGGDKKDEGKDDSSLPPSNLAMELDSPLSSVLSNRSPALSRTRTRRRPGDAEDDVEMLDPETQLADMESQILDSIQSFSLDDIDARSTPKNRKKVVESTDSPSTPMNENVKDVGLDCSCGIDIEDQMCFCEAGCGRWYHVWCMGYHSARDPRLPNKFTCLDCRLKADVSWTLIEGEIYEALMERYRDLVTFRRAIKIFEHSDTMTAAEFSKGLGNSINYRQILKRLEDEEFIHQITTTLDDFGMATDTRLAKNKKSKDRKVKQVRKNVQKTRYAFDKKVKSEQQYLDYFNPNQKVENKLIGLDNLKNFSHFSSVSVNPTGRAKSVGLGMVPEILAMDTQEDNRVEEAKRGPKDEVREEDERPAKRLKISLATGIDLAEG